MPPNREKTYKERMMELAAEGHCISSAKERMYNEGYKKSRFSQVLHAEDINFATEEEE